MSLLHRLFRRARRLAPDRQGTAAIEFALLAPLVVMMVFSTLEAGWIMTQSVMLDRGTSRASRALQLGNKGKLTYLDFKKLICSEALVLLDCATMLSVEMTPINSRDDFPKSGTPCVDRKTEIDPVTQFKSGVPSQIVFVRACYTVDALTPGLGLGFALSKDNDGGLQLLSQFAFVNELD